MRRKRNTYLFLLVLLAIISVGFLIQRYFFGKTGATAIIEQDGETISELDLSKDTELVLDDGNGGSNTITVKNGKIAVTDAIVLTLSVYTQALSLRQRSHCLPST